VVRYVLIVVIVSAILWDYARFYSPALSCTIFCRSYLLLPNSGGESSASKDIFGSLDIMLDVGYRSVYWYKHRLFIVVRRLALVIIIILLTDATDVRHIAEALSNCLPYVDRCLFDVKLVSTKGRYRLHSPIL